MRETSPVYAREPLRIEDGIPIFSSTSDYTANYERISSDHLKILRSSGENPFIPEELWTQFEDSTMSHVQKYARHGDYILDVGVGLGRLLDRLPHLRRFGVDISMGYLAEAREKGIDVCYALIEELPYQPELFDVIVCTDVLEHVLDLNRCCENMLSALRPDGTLVVRVPYREELWPYLEEDYPYRYVHVRNFDEYSIRTLFERIFDCRVLEVTMSGYRRSPARLQYRMPIPGWSRFIDNRMAFLERRRPNIHSVLTARMYQPIVMNVAVAKS